MDRYRIDLPNGRSITLAADQLRRIARGLGDHLDQPIADGHEPTIVEALRALPATRRAEALAVVVLRFGDKLDVESIAHNCGLNPWEVWQLEESFCQALAEARVARHQMTPGPASEREESQTARVMSPEMLANAIAHGKQVSLEREHEASLQASRQTRR